MPDVVVCQRTETNARGWYDDELTKQTRDWKEGFDVGHVPEPDKPPEHPSNVVVEGYNQWPGESVPSFKVREHRRGCPDQCCYVLACIRAFPLGTLICAAEGILPCASSPSTSKPARRSLRTYEEDAFE